MQKLPDKYSITMHRPNVVLLGAGASRAAFPNGDKNGRKLPLMNDFVEIVDGLAVYLEGVGVDYKNKNFEEVYSHLYNKYGITGSLQNIQEIVYEYFAAMELPYEPTLYDHLVLSLRKGDIIATFNWDPFLWQALSRNQERVGKENLPYYLFLHGNTAIAICTNHQYITVGHRSCKCPQCGKVLENCKLLYPISQKDYDKNPFIKSAWDMMRSFLSKAFIFTIFGYGAPQSDVAAIALLQEGWGNVSDRNLEQVQIIDLLSEEELTTRWKSFIHTHHYNIYSSFYHTHSALHGRRSCDALWNAIMECNPRERYPIQRNATWDEIDEWLKPLLEEENKAKKSV